MDRFDLHELYRPLLCLFFALTVFACNGGGCSGCAGCGIEPIPGAYPIEHRITNATQVRLSRSGVVFLEENISSIVANFLPDGLDFPVDRQDIDVGVGTVTVCSDNDCTAHLEITELDLTPTAPNVVTAHVRLILDSRNRAGMRDEWSGTCDLDVDTRRGGRVFVGFVADIVFDNTTQPARLNYTRVRVEDPGLVGDEGIENDDLEISGAWYCAGANLFLKGFIIDQLESRIGGLVDGVLNDQLCTTRGEYGCPTDTFAVPDEDPASTCRFANDPDAECVPILLGTDGRGDMGGTLIGGFSPGTHAYAQFLLASGQEGEAVNEGMSLFFYGGFMGMDREFMETPAHHPCVPLIEPPALPVIPRVDAFRGNVIPGTAERMDVGIGIAEQFMNYAGYGMFDSGMLCIGAGTRLSQQLSSGLVSAAIMSLPELTFPLTNAPLTIAVRPQVPPVFSVGAGDEAEPLLDITLAPVEIDFYVWSTERYVRFMTFRTDLSIGINLAVEGGQIVPTIVYVRSDNSSVTNSELLQEQPTALAATLETLVSSLAGMLGGSISPFDLPAIMGFNLEVPAGGVTRVREGEEDFLGIFANLTLAAPMSIVSPVETSLELSDLSLDRASMDPDTWNQGEGNSVWLHFASQGPLAVDYEYSYRIDGGPWSAWTQEPRLRIDDDVLLLQARHEIEARSRVVGEPASVDPTPAFAELVVDILPPTLRVARTMAGVEVEATDVVTPAADLEYRYFIDGAWSEWSHQTSAALAVDAGGVLVEARDESGNVGRSQAALIRGLPNPEGGGGCGCRVPGGNGGSLPLALLGLLAAIGTSTLRRRRRSAGTGGSRRPRRFPVPFLGALTLVALLVSGCECSSGPACGGLCLHALAPSTAGNVCCPSTDMCVNYDIAVLCDPGYTCAEANIVPDEMCNVTCLECEPKPELDPGTLATYLDAVVDTSGQVFVSGYSPGDAQEEQLYGDLVFGTWNGASVDWEIVDGRPNGPITNHPERWRGGVSEPGDNVGQWTSLVDQGGTFLITYYDVTHGALKLAAGGPGAWSTHTIDDTGDSGRYSSLVLDGSGNPAVAYLRVQESAETPGQTVSSVIVAVAATANPTSATDWILTEVAQSPVPCRPRYCGTGATCIEEGQCVMPSSDCTETCASGSVCFNGSCRASIPATFVEDLPPFNGLYTSLVATSTGFALVWYDRSSGNLYGSRNDGAEWSEPFLIDGYGLADPFTGDSGMGADLAVDEAGVWHVVYIDGAEETLRYAQVQPDGTITREVVDDGSTNGLERHTDGRHIIGDDASIVVVSTGQVRVVYQDATSQNAVVAVRAAGDSAWVIQHFDDAGSTGYWLEQELLGTTSYAVMWWQQRSGRNVDNGVRVITLE